MSKVHSTTAYSEEADDATLRVDVAGAQTFVELPDHPPGHRVGRYEIRRVAGRGGMGVVYVAHDPQLDREVALKLIVPRGSKALDADAQARLVREARAMAQLSHPNIIAVYDVGISEGAVFIAMEHVVGNTLRKLVVEGSSRWRDAVRLFVAAGRGLAAAHAVGLVHRDFKPGNVLVGADDRVRVMDFGLATDRRNDSIDGTRTGHSRDSAIVEADASASSLTRTGVVMGTPAYMAPEQHAGERATELTDQFSFCVALFEALYGVRPFSGKSQARLARMKRDGEIAKVDETRGVPSWLHHVVLRGLAADPTQRWPSMNHLVRVLERGPSHRRVVVWMGGAALVAGTTGALFAFSSDAQRCGEARRPVDDIWNAQVRDEAHAAMLATSVALASDTWERIEPRLDDYAERLIEARVDACEAGQGGTLGEQVLTDRRLACLDGKLTEFRALVAALRKSDDKLVLEATSAVGSLAPPSACSDREALSASVDPPTEAQRASVERLRARLAEIQTRERTGHIEEAGEQIEALWTESLAVGYGPLVAEVGLIVGNVWDELGRKDDAREALEQAHLAAEASGYDLAAGKIAVRLSLLTLGSEGGLPRAEQWLESAEASAKRLGKQSDLHAAIETARSLLYARRGNFAAAEKAAATCVEIREGIAEPYDVQLGVALANHGAALARLQKLDEAKQTFERALEVLAKSLGPGHPHLAGVHNNIGTLLRSRGEPDRASEHLRRSLEILQRAFGPDHPAVAPPSINLASLEADRDNRDEAMALLRNAIEILESSEGANQNYLAIAHQNLGRFLLDVGDHDGAFTHLQRGIALIETNKGTDHPDLASPYAALGSAYLVRGDLDQAERHFDRALELQTMAAPDNPNRAGPLDDLGIVYREQGRLDRALEVGLESLEIRKASLPEDHPTLGIGRTNLGDTYLARGEVDKARFELEEAIRILEQDDDAREALAEARFSLAKTLWRIPSEQARAIELARRAHRELTEYGPTLTVGADDVESWLSTRRRR